MIEAELQHFRIALGDAIMLEGPDLELAPNDALSFGLAVHELATNAVKYGDGRNSGPFPNARDRLILGAAKHGLQRRDVHPCVNLFKGTKIEDDGTIYIGATDGFIRRPFLYLGAWYGLAAGALAVILSVSDDTDVCGIGVFDPRRRDHHRPHERRPGRAGRTGR